MPRGAIAGLAAAAAAVALIVGVSVVWPGLDAQQTAKIDTTVWALQTGEGSRYARVNTAVGELDTVRDVTNPSQVAQGASGAYLFTDSNSKVTAVDPSTPVDLVDAAVRSSPTTPDGTVDVVTADDFVAYRTDTGAVHVGRLSTGETAVMDPFPDDSSPQFTSDAVAVDSRGMVFSYSADDGSVLRYDIVTGEVRGRERAPSEGVEVPEITAAGDQWVLVDGGDGRIWYRGGPDEPVQSDMTSVVVSAPDPAGAAVFLADQQTLVRVATDGSDLTVELSADGPRGVPARPLVHDGNVFAAWLPAGRQEGLLWSSQEGGTETALVYAAGSLPDEPRPTFVATDDVVVLNETRSGWVWDVPDGRLLPSSQDWSLDEETNPDAEPSDESEAIVIDPRPPVAEPDVFGVRADSLTSLPVLLNDHDPNEDVLSIDPASVAGLDPAFGVVTLTDDAQRLAVRVAAGASGSATFVYGVTDGTAVGGLASAPTTVTLTVADEDVNSAPRRCEGPCDREWPAPEVARGGTVTVPVLPGWIDPEGDPILLLSVQNPSGIGTAAATPDGDVVYQHSASDGTADTGSDELIELVVTVSDTRGQTTDETLTVRVAADPALTAQSFAVVDTIGSGLTVDIAPHVTGTAGMVSLQSVRVLDDAAATATVVGGSTSFDFAAQAPGTFRVAFTATDGVRDAIGTARITILPEDAPAQLATSPIVAFVRPQEDASLDVFDAAFNPTRRVLLLSDVVGDADPGGTLSVDAVGQNYLRVSGSTASGAPGRLGTVSYTIGDGTDDAGATVAGEATVYLLPPAPELAPIAVDDTVVVRAGAQIDIPVLENDIAPSGGRPTLNPATVTSSSPAALAFAGGDVLRYLAPTVPGNYTVEYGVYTTGSPGLADTASVRIEVLPDDTNRSPLPQTLEGRVLSGQSTVIDFDDFGMDPDGDVVTLDRIVVQPERGSATISADGGSIVYSSVPGDKGQFDFRYRAVDALGQTGEGIVRVGVLDGQSNPSPVTFTDYVQVQAGAESTITVSPLANDVDPTGGALKITEVRPDLPVSLVDGSANPEYDRLKARLQAVGETGVLVSAGTEPATMSFLYDVESTSGNTGRGLIVVRVVRESVPDYPVVTDTVLTAETRDGFEDGVDVLAGKVTWSGGEAADLAVTLWGQPQDVLVQGSRLRGPLPVRSRVIPFAVTGERAGEPVTSYAFLRVPGADDMSLALRSDVRPQPVDELSAVSFDMADLVAGPRDAAIEVSADLRSSGARPAASCAIESGTVVRYEAGAGAPWADACQIPVRVVGQAEWTVLWVPIAVTATNPQPVLRPGSITVGPGETALFDLRNMTTWQVREDWSDIRYELEYGGSAFDVAVNGSIVTVTGRDRATPGSEDAVVISVSSHAAVAPARLILRVGAAPSTLPQGGSVTQQCSQAAGSSCEIAVVGASGEVNPLPNTPLVVSEVRAAGDCSGVTFEVASPTAVRASWAADAPGATCTATFSVTDAQGRRSNAERDGRIQFDLQGFPRAPAGIAQTAYADGSLTLRVDPGEARQAYPALGGFVIRWGGQQVAQCSADGTCPTISAPNGEKRTYDAYAFNRVGTSASGARTVAWAYDPPAAPTSVQVQPVVTTGAGGVVALEVSGIDPSETGAVDISSPSGDSIRVPVSARQSTIEVPSYRVGANTASAITVTAVSRFEAPPLLDGSPVTSAIVVSGNGIGAPLQPALALTSQSDGDGTSTVTAQGDAVLNGDGSTLRYGIVPEGERCVPSADGRSRQFTDLPDGEEYAFDVCVEAWYDGTSYGASTATASVRAAQSAAPPTGYAFTVDATPNVSPNRAEWVVRNQPTSAEAVPNRNVIEVAGLPSPIFDRDPQIQVRYVHETWGTASAWTTATPQAGSAPYQVQASWGVGSCVGGADLVVSGDSSADTAGGKAAISFENTGLQYYDASGAPIAHAAGTWTVPVGATRVDGIAVSVAWSAQSWGLAPASTSFSASCEPNIPPTTP